MIDPLAVGDEVMVPWGKQTFIQGVVADLRGDEYVRVSISDDHPLHLLVRKDWVTLGKVSDHLLAK